MTSKNFKNPNYSYVHIALYTLLGYMCGVCGSFIGSATIVGLMLGKSLTMAVIFTNMAIAIIDLIAFQYFISKAEKNGKIPYNYF